MVKCKFNWYINLFCTQVQAKDLLLGAPSGRGKESRQTHISMSHTGMLVLVIIIIINTIFIEESLITKVIFISVCFKIQERKKDKVGPGTVFIISYLHITLQTMLQNNYETEVIWQLLPTVTFALIQFDIYQYLYTCTYQIIIYLSISISIYQVTNILKLNCQNIQGFSTRQAVRGNTRRHVSQLESYFFRFPIAHLLVPPMIDCQGSFKHLTFATCAQERNERKNIMHIHYCNGTGVLGSTRSCPTQDLLGDMP